MCQQLAPIEIYVKNKQTKTKTLYAVNKQPLYICDCIHIDNLFHLNYNYLIRTGRDIRVYANTFIHPKCRILAR